MKPHLLLALLLLPWIARAEEPPAPPDPLAAAQKIVDGLHFQEGDIKLGDGFAEVRLPDDFRFLGPDDAETVLTKLWNNPPRKEKPLGLLVPAHGSPIDANSWAVILTYVKDGYVKDNDATSIDYAKLLKQMQESIHAANTERAKQGYPEMELVGWAEPPRYDATTHKMYWAKALKRSGEERETLNYNIRILGRHGVLVLNAVAGMDQLPTVEAATPALLGMVDFTEGNRYADYKPGADKVATYGLAALVAGGILAKAGAFKFLWVGLLALKKFIVVGVVAAGAWLKQFFKKSSM
jgi:uncharacterized membrane-anchored protein